MLAAGIKYEPPARIYMLGAGVKYNPPVEKPEDVVKEDVYKRSSKTGGLENATK